MKLNDIREDIGVLSNPLTNPPPKPWKKIGVQDGEDIWEASPWTDTKIYFIIHNETMISYVITEVVDVDTEKFMETHTIQEQRKKGYASIIVTFLLNKLKKRLWITSDERVSKDSRDIIIALARIGRLKAFDEYNNPINNDDLIRMASMQGKTNDSFYLKDDSIKEEFEIFSDKRIATGSEWYVIKNIPWNPPLD